jgi:hypothetical protein
VALWAINIALLRSSAPRVARFLHKTAIRSMLREALLLITPAPFATPRAGSVGWTQLRCVLFNAMIVLVLMIFDEEGKLLDFTIKEDGDFR